MEKNNRQKKENDRAENWYARMNAIEAIWQKRMEEGRTEYLETFNQFTKKRSEVKFLLQ